MNHKSTKAHSLVLKPLLRLTALSFVLFALVACGTPSPIGTTNITEYVGNLPSWQEVSPLKEENNGEATGATSPAKEQIVDDQVYSCETQNYSLTKNPEQIVMFDPNAGIIWPGALIQGKSHINGSLQLLALDKSRRAPLGLYVKGGGVLGIKNGVSTIIEQPVGSTVSESINQLIVNAHESDVAVGAGFSQFKSVESYSGTQATMQLGLSGRYLGAKASADLKYQQSAQKYTYTAYFIQRLYTMVVDQPESPAAFFSDNTTAQDLRSFGIDSENLPLYISSVSYGRILMYSFTSSESRRKIEAALEFSYDSPVGGVDGYASAELQQTLKNAEIEVLAIGGPNTGVKQLIQDGDLASYFEAELELNQVEPISFNLRNLGDNSLAKVSNTTDYDVETCTSIKAALPQPTHWWQAEGNADDAGNHNTFENNLEYGAGKYGQAFAMNGEDSYIAGYKPQATTFDTTAAFTFSMWINPRKSASRYYDIDVLAAETGPRQEAGQFLLGRISTSSTNQLFFQRRANSGSKSSDTIYSTANVAPSDVWTHIVAVYGGAGEGENNIRLFINGEKVKTGVGQNNFITDGFVTSDQRTRFGSAGYRKSDVKHAYPYNGLMDEIMTFDRALSDDEIKRMYESFEDYKN